MALLAVTELIAITARNSTYPGAGTGLLDVLYGVSSVAVGVGLILAGIAVRRGGRWSGWRGLVVLVAGIFVFVPMMPALAGPVHSRALGHHGLDAALRGSGLRVVEGRPAMSSPAAGDAEAPVAVSVTSHPQGASSPWMWTAGGAVCGLAWSAALRGYMVELVGVESTFTWSGTFGAVLLPGAVTGGLLGWAEHLRRVGPPRGWRLLALAPLTLAVAPMLIPGAFTTLVTTGMGSGAIAVGLMGVVGGYTLSGRGRRWTRAVCGARGVAFAAALAATVAGMTDPPLSLTDPRGAWAAVLAASLYLVLALGSSIPQRSVVVAVPRRGEC